MPQFMLLIQDPPAAERSLSPADVQALVEGRAAFARTLRDTDAFLDGERLRPANEARRVRVRAGRAQVETGPFPEPPIDAFFAVEAPDLDAAVRLAERCPMAPGSAFEVRPIMKGTHAPDKTSQPGRVFAFAVLGSAATEPAWIDIMDRIDASSRNAPNPRTIAGVRLQPPRTGRRVVASGNQRTIFDGPFLESKEVIGGIFFQRLSSMDEAVEWACGTKFVEIGGVEIRELWRS